MSHACGRRLHRICVPAPVLQRRCPARPHFVWGRGAVSRSRRLMQFSRFGYEELQAGGPAANSLGKIKKAAPQGTKRFCRRCTAAKWFGVVAERLFSSLKQLIRVRGYHETIVASRERSEFCGDEQEVGIIICARKQKSICVVPYRAP